MRAFHFPLNSVLRYRETQRQLRETAVAAAAARVTAIDSLRIRIGAECAEQAKVITGADRMSGDALGAWAEFASRARRRIAVLEKQGREAHGVLTAERVRLVEADSNLRLVETLKDDRFAVWRREFDREERTFADEAFLARLNRG